MKSLWLWPQISSATMRNSLFGVCTEVSTNLNTAQRRSIFSFRLILTCVVLFIFLSPELFFHGHAQIVFFLVPSVVKPSCYVVLKKNRKNLKKKKKTISYMYHVFAHYYSYNSGPILNVMILNYRWNIRVQNKTKTKKLFAVNTRKKNK